jgi:micrococcal nuclease
MKLHQITRILFLLALPLSFSTQSSASSLQGKVIAVLDGERVTVLSVNQPLQVKLMGMAAPTGKQAFADEARQHLSDLAAGKYVVVSYTSFSHDGYVMGRVVVNSMDVGQQMIRDGVAWFQPSEVGTLSDMEKQAYAGCEQAARSEGRGLWQDPAAQAPWQFRWQEAANRNLISKPQTLVAKSARSGKAQLSNDDLFRSMTETGELSHTVDSGWKTISPQAAKFSVYVPANAVEFGATIPTATGGVVEANYSFGRRGRRSYLMMWAKGPNDGATDDQVADAAANGFGFGLQRSTNQGFEVRRQRAVRLGPYTGWQYSLSAPGIPGAIRVYSRLVGQFRLIYLMVAVNGTEEDPQVKEFFGSIAIEKY